MFLHSVTVVSQWKAGDESCSRSENRERIEMMLKKAIGIAFALVAVTALVGPAAASASKLTSDSAGLNLVKLGVGFEALGGTDQLGLNAVKMRTELGEISCQDSRSMDR
jgi:hypothetical protein